MKEINLQKLIRTLRILVVAAFVCNIIALCSVPVLVMLSPKGAVEAGLEGLSYLLGLAEMPGGDFIYVPFTLRYFISWVVVWDTAYTGVLTVFLWICGICTAVILWQAKRVLDNMAQEKPFSYENGRYLKIASRCCYVISVVSLARTVWGFCHYRSLAPLLTYNFLFCPLFLMAGLLFMVMSALFGQAAELKEENDLTI